MSLLHRALLSAAFKEMLQKFEPIVQDTLETAVAVVAPAAAPAIDAGIELAAVAAGLKRDSLDVFETVAGAPAGATSSDHVAAAVAAATAPSAGAVSPTPSAASVAVNAAPAAAPSPAALSALAACDSIANTLAQLATQIAAIRSNLS